MKEVIHNMRYEIAKVELLQSQGLALQTCRFKISVVKMSFFRHQFVVGDVTTSSLSVGQLYQLGWCKMA